MAEPIYHLRDYRLIGGNFATFQEINHMLENQCHLAGDKVILVTPPENIRPYMKDWGWFDEKDGTFSITIAREHTVIRRMHLSVAKDPCPAGLTRIYVYVTGDYRYGRVLQLPYDHPFFTVYPVPTKTLEDGYYRAYELSAPLPPENMTDVTAILEIVNPHNLVDETFNDFWRKWASLTPDQQEKASVAIARISNLKQEYDSIVGKTK